MNKKKDPRIIYTKLPNINHNKVIDNKKPIPDVKFSFNNDSQMSGALLAKLAGNSQMSGALLAKLAWNEAHKSD